MIPRWARASHPVDFSSNILRTTKSSSFALSWTLGAALVLGGVSTSASAAVISARSGLAADIQAAVNLAKTGDTVAIPAGTFHFTGQVYAPDGIYIRGAGRDSTFLVKSDNTSELHGMIIVDAKTGLPFKFSDITLQGRLDALQGSNRTTAVTTVADGGLYIKGAAQNFKIFNVRVHEVPAGRDRISGRCRLGAGRTDGVIYHNEFIDNWYTIWDMAWRSTARSQELEQKDQRSARPMRFSSRTITFRPQSPLRHLDQRRQLRGPTTTPSRTTTRTQQSFDAHGLSSRLAPGNQKRRDLWKHRDQFHHPLGRCWNPGRQRGHLGQYLERRVAWRGRSRSRIRRRRIPSRIYPALDQIGNPYDVFIIWNNISTGDSVYKNPTSNSHGIDYWLRLGRDYSRRPSRATAPYAYPHPLRTETP